VRLGLYIDAQYRDEGGRVLTEFESFPFLRFGTEVGGHFDELVLFGRAAPAGVGVDHALRPGPRLAPLPYYENLARLGAVVRATSGVVRAMWRGLERVDVVWAFGPHPFALLLALLALARRKRVVLGVRQDTLTYFRARLRSRRAAPLLAPLWVLDRAWKLLARAVPVTVVGGALERLYGGPRRGVLAMTISLVRGHDIAAEPRPQGPGDEVELLTVGRLEPEKNPVLAVEALAALQGENGRRYRLTWVGTGRLDGEVRAAAERLGVADRVELPGYVPFGPELMERYRRADVFVHVAVTEGAPQVLLEALSTATPVVATDVGGVAATLEDGAAGELVPPRDATALAAAVARTVADDAARRTRVERGLAIARERSLEAEAARVAQWILGRGAPAPPLDAGRGRGRA
jgi:glycosyltransferase involved in cell wall biosynthesis